MVSPHVASCPDLLGLSPWNSWDCKHPPPHPARKVFLRQCLKICLRDLLNPVLLTASMLLMFSPVASIGERQVYIGDWAAILILHSLQPLQPVDLLSSKTVKDHAPSMDVEFTSHSLVC
jgi:hypothetical protein